MNLNLTDKFNPPAPDSRELVAGFAGAFSRAASAKDPAPALTITPDVPGVFR
jgi:hypothetical protein